MVLPFASDEQSYLRLSVGGNFRKRLPWAPHSRVLWCTRTLSISFVRQSSVTAVGMGDAVVCRRKCHWGRFVDKDFFRKVALFTTEDFDSNGSHKLCMEHFSPDSSPTAIKVCNELVRCFVIYPARTDARMKAI